MAIWSSSVQLRAFTRTLPLTLDDAEVLGVSLVPVKTAGVHVEPTGSVMVTWPGSERSYTTASGARLSMMGSAVENWLDMARNHQLRFRRPQVFNGIPI